MFNKFCLQIPQKTEVPAKAREEDVYKLVSDLIGGGAKPTSPTPTPTSKPTTSAAAATETQKQAPPTSGGRSKAVKLVVDQLAPVNIRPKVRNIQVVELATL